MVQVPNGFGCALGVLQLIVYAFYCGNKDQNMKTTDGSPLELGQANGGAGAEKPNHDQRQVSNQEDST